MYHLYDHVLVLYTHEHTRMHTHTHMNHTHAHTHMNTHTHITAAISPGPPEVSVLLQQVHESSQELQDGEQAVQHGPHQDEGTARPRYVLDRGEEGEREGGGRRRERESANQ